MTVCNFFLQGRCRYGDKCWNEHPRGGDYRGNQQPSRGGFGNRVWVNPSQRSGNEFIQPSTFSRDGGNWGRRDAKSSDFSFSTQNRFSTLNSQNNTDKGGQTSADDNIKHVDTIQADMESWQSSGQWPFSCYSVLSAQISGFVELCPEELRLEYYTSRASGDLQTYMNSIQQLANQWKTRVQELKTMNKSTQMSVISELNNSSQTSSHGFGSSSSGFNSTSGFGSTSATSGTGFGSTSATSGTGFGSTSATSGTGFGSTSGTSGTGFGSTSASSSGFGTGGFGSSSQSSNTFSFAPPRSGFGTVNTQQASGFGSTAVAQPPSASTFSFAAPATENKPNTSAPGWSAGPSFQSAGAFGTGFGSSAASSGGSLFGAAAAGDTGSSGDAGDKLFTARSDLTAEELKEFTAKRFTLGQIPLKPPPVDLLMV
ncbi:nucleoporin NUP42 isoform X1 [Misgurnus anguillicaudatus]|uniref:nucleoporin NUP42 isoform X1 n=1 Tax=Misgurnus anguillicaudatus TaxID=75329 RepID=UPI003CCF0AF0